MLSLFELQQNLEIEDGATPLFAFLKVYKFSKSILKWKSFTGRCLQNALFLIMINTYNFYIDKNLSENE